MEDKEYLVTAIEKYDKSINNHQKIATILNATFLIGYAFSDLALAIALKFPAFFACISSFILSYVNARHLIKKDINKANIEFLIQHYDEYLNGISERINELECLEKEKWISYHKDRWLFLILAISFAFIQPRDNAFENYFKIFLMGIPGVFLLRSIHGMEAYYQTKDEIKCLKELMLKRISAKK